MKSVIGRPYIQDSINLIINDMSETLLRNESIVVSNFGTISSKARRTATTFNTDGMDKAWSVRFHKDSKFKERIKTLKTFMIARKEPIKKEE